MWLWHVIGWLAFISYEQLTRLLTHEQASSSWGMVLVIYLINSTVFYTNCTWLLPRLYGRRRYLFYSLAIVSLLVSYASVRSLLYFTSIHQSQLPYTIFTYWFLAFYRGIFFFCLSSSYWFAISTLRLEQQKSRQTIHLHAIERRLLETQLSFLKSQLNPHFLFNTLHALYAEVYPHSQQAADNIQQLAVLMRYALQDNEMGKIPLQQEISYLRSYVTLQQLRYRETLHLHFEVTGTDHFLLIAPLVLSTFIENCFHHGELNNSAAPLRITVDIRHNQLELRTCNRKRPDKEQAGHGLGLLGVRERLEHFYAGRYELRLLDEPETFTCHLILTL